MASCTQSEDFLEELELLQAIYVNEIELVQGSFDRPECVKVFLHPSTGNDDEECKYVCLNLCLFIPNEYPNTPPNISIENPRGLSDAHIISIQENLIALSKEKIGSPMLFDLIEYTKDCLSDNNIPSCPCVICLEHFGEEDKFVKTECYHYFHASCLSKYIKHLLNSSDSNETVCPMCRLHIKFNNDCDVAEKEDELFVYKPNEQELKDQAERQRLFEYQKRKGGIIDTEQERNKFLIVIKDSEVKLLSDLTQSISSDVTGTEKVEKDCSNISKFRKDDIPLLKTGRGDVDSRRIVGDNMNIGKKWIDSSRMRGDRKQDIGNTEVVRKDNIRFRRKKSSQQKKNDVDNEKRNERKKVSRMRDDKQNCNIEIKFEHCGNEKRLENKDKRLWNDSLRHNKTSDDFYRFSEVKEEQSLRSRDNTEKTFRNKEEKS